MHRTGPPGSLRHALGLELLVCMGLSVVLCEHIARCFYWPAGHGLDIHQYQLGRDFINNWAAPRIAWSGHVQTLFSMDGYVRAIGEQFGQPLPFHNWGYPPFALVLFWPLAQLPYFYALAAWTVGTFAAYAWASARFVEPGRRKAMILALAFAPACLINAIGGQNGFVTGALLIGALLSLDRRPLLAGVLIGMLTLKPQLGLVLPFVLLALRAWRTIAAACVTVVLLVAVSVAAFGIEPWIRYVTETSAFQVSLLQHPQGFYMNMMVSVLAQLRLAGAPYMAALVVQGVVSLAVVGATVWAVLRTRDAKLRACVIILATPLITPYAFNYDLTAVAACLTWRMMSGERSWGGLFPILAWLWPGLGMMLSIFGLPLAPLVLAPLFGFSLFWVAKEGAAAKAANAQMPAQPGLAPA